MNMKISFNLENFTPIDEGERTLKITKAECKPSGKPTQAEVTFVEVTTNKTLKSRYDFNNQYGLMAFGFLCRTALGIPDMGEFETSDIGQLVGKVVVCEIAHTEGTQPREDGTFPVFANIKKVLRRLDVEAPYTGETTTSSPRASIKSVGDDLD